MSLRIKTKQGDTKKATNWDERSNTGTTSYGRAISPQQLQQQQQPSVVYFSVAKTTWIPSHYQLLGDRMWPKGQQLTWIQLKTKWMIWSICAMGIWSVRFDVSDNNEEIKLKTTSWFFLLEFFENVNFTIQLGYKVYLQHIGLRDLV